MSTLNLLYKDAIEVTPKIRLAIPKVGDILDDEDGYYAGVSALTAQPISMMVQLDDFGIDFTKVDDYTLFLMLFPGLQEADSPLIFKDLPLSGFQMAEEERTGEVVLLDRERDIVIDRLVHAKISAAMRSLHGIERDNRKPGNEAARKYMIERARIKMKRTKNKKQSSQLESLIIAMVNTEQFKYDFEGTRELSIYQFNESVKQIVKKVDYTNRMVGVYTGNIDIKQLSREELSWI